MSTKFSSRNHRAAKLTEALVEQMRARYAAGEVTQGDLAREYNVSVVQIGRIVRGESWATNRAITPRDQDIAASAARMFAVQQEVNARRAAGEPFEPPVIPIAPEPQPAGSALAKMQTEIQKRRDGDADHMLNELTGDKDA